MASNLDKAIIEYHRDGFSIPEIAELLHLDEGAVAMSLKMNSIRQGNSSDVKAMFKEHEQTITQTILDMIQDPDVDYSVRAKLAMYASDVNLGARGSEKKGGAKVSVLMINKFMSRAREAYDRQMDGVQLDLDEGDVSVTGDEAYDQGKVMRDNVVEPDPETMRRVTQRKIEREHAHLLTIPEDT